MRLGDNEWGRFKCIHCGKQMSIIGWRLKAAPIRCTCRPEMGKTVVRRIYQ